MVAAADPGHSVTYRGMAAPAASEASATAHMLGSKPRLKPQGLKFNPLGKKQSCASGLQVGLFSS